MDQVPNQNSNLSSAEIVELITIKTSEILEELRPTCSDNSGNGFSAESNGNGNHPSSEETQNVKSESDFKSTADVIRKYLEGCYDWKSAENLNKNTSVLQGMKNGIPIQLSGKGLTFNVMIKNTCSILHYILVLIRYLPYSY